MKALVLSGGGANGAFEVGAIQYLLGERREHFPILTGVSVGALNAAMLAMYPEGAEVDCSRNLTRVWETIRGNKGIYTNWSIWGKLAATARCATGMSKTRR